MKVEQFNDGGDNAKTRDTIRGGVVFTYKEGEYHYLKLDLGVGFLQIETNRIIMATQLPLTISNYKEFPNAKVVLG